MRPALAKSASVPTSPATVTEAASPMITSVSSSLAVGSKTSGGRILISEPGAAMSAALDSFLDSLEGKEPKRGLSPAMQALWWAAKGDWSRAHALAQEDA